MQSSNQRNVDGRVRLLDVEGQSSVGGLLNVSEEGGGGPSPISLFILAENCDTCITEINKKKTPVPFCFGKSKLQK